ncbi:response regulator transcription factor [Egibacter rhizosphaerae]|uniref:response regulator transcription factor n=1 Tax=Egibacter rhizosphaerae TaxID=1670831 RepID=UPI00197B0115|nr:response regulator [Egibacter rhizosphaerae]
MARVLVVDDDQVIRGLLEVNLEMEGHDAVLAADGRAGLESARAEPPDLVLLDVMMPELSGWQVAEELLGDPATSSIPIVFLTARAMEADVRRGHELGVEHYVTKPFDPIDLMNLVNELLSRQEPA